MVKVALLDDYQGIALSKADWGSLPEGSQVESFSDHLSDEDALAKRLEPFEVIVGMRERTPFPRSLLSRLPNLKLLITTGGRNASFDVEAAREMGITICGTRGAGAPTAELTWGLIIGLMRHIAEEDKAIRGGAWQTTIGPMVQGLTLGCVGLGNLGSRAAKVGLAFGMDVIAWSQNLTAERCHEVGARLVTKEELFSQADVVTVHMVLSDRSRGLIGEREFSLMKPSAYFINTSRGPIADEAALVAALRERRIAGAGLDVYDVEPLPQEHPLRSMDNTLLTPHIGYVVSQAYDVYYSDALEDVLAYLKGEPVRVVER